MTADTGIDALTRAVEAFVNRKADPFSDGLALNAIRTSGRHLGRVYADGGDAEDREAMMLAATQACIALSNASAALVHGFTARSARTSTSPTVCRTRCSSPR
ncbi:iron-containing alcohol dehydrogenase [Streptomyces sp. NPDC020489]|uniref:iron-containing alcohol dehydrogenase n=1 Tax=Streptomyces sp. NPDC020489 TaxID=3365077 RepID=UPI0037BC177C